MPYVTRDATGSIVAVYDRPKRSAKERVRSDDPALQHFLLDPRERRVAREQPLDAAPDSEYEPEYEYDYDYEDEEEPATETETAPPPQAPPQAPQQQAPPPQQPAPQQPAPQQQAAPQAAPAPQQTAPQPQQAAPPPPQAAAPTAPQGAAPGGGAAAPDDDGAQNILNQTDFDMARISEDLIDVLIGKNIINFTDFPKPAQDKLMRRRQLRSNLSTLTSLVGDDDSIL
ncbi:MAG: hypothetical protein QF654_05000 [Alphaproteobacteria bacterium]|nr:hypothetical protein [Alphaproteobacteria bacterium]